MTTPSKKPSPPPLGNLLTCAFKGDLQEALVHLEAGSDVNMTDNSSSTPLIFAADSGHLDMVKLLLAAGADPSLKDKWGSSALDGAAANRSGSRPRGDATGTFLFLSRWQTEHGNKALLEDDPVFDRVPPGLLVKWLPQRVARELVRRRAEVEEIVEMTKGEIDNASLVKFYKFFNKKLL
jgi:hypothetical protein